MSATIEPSRFYTGEEVTTLLGLDPRSVEAAVSAGKLQRVNGGGSGPLFEGYALLGWLRAGANTGTAGGGARAAGVPDNRATPGRRGSAVAGAGTGGVSGDKGTAAAGATNSPAPIRCGDSSTSHNADADPVKCWQDMIALKRKGGLTMAAAVRELAKEQPTLHRLYVSAVNGRAGRKVKVPNRMGFRGGDESPTATIPAASFADPVEAFESAVAAQRKCGVDPARAVRAVVHENPGLHKAYLAAVNS